ncbi:MAG TPA: YncE family protein [Candidatus Sulfotelmatobacter sp.]|nr:YncE family protein [Candidatus Sulfotelmatobacter sp.]
MKCVTKVVANLLLGICIMPSYATSVKSIPVGNLPTFVALNQTTNRIYVSNLTDNTVSVIDGASDAVIATVAVGSFPEAIGVNPLTNLVYVANLLSGTVSVIDGTSNTVVATVSGVVSPFGVAVDSATNQIFVSSSNGQNYVAVVDGATNTILTKVTVGNIPLGLRVNSATNLVYVANELSGTVSVIDGRSDSLANTFALPQGAQPTDIGMDPITNRLFVVSSSNTSVYVLDASTGDLLQTITGGKIPFKSPGIAAMFQPGKTVLVSDSSLNAVMEFSESTYAAIGGLKGGNKPFGIAVNRKTGKTYVTENGSNTVNVYSSSANPSTRSRSPK